MPYCTNCGEEVTEKQRFCSYCGEQVGEESRGKGRKAPPRREPRDKQPRQPREERTRQPRDQPDSTGRHPDQERPPADGEQEDVAEGGIPRQRTTETYFESLRRIFTQPLPLLGLFVAWFIVSALVLFPPGAGLAVFLLCSALGLVAAGMAYVQTEAAVTDGEATTGDAARKTLGQFLSLFVIWILYVPAVLIGLMLFILPGLYIGGRLLLAFPACVLDKEGALDSLSTSWDLTKAISLKPIGLFILAFITMIGLVFVLTIPQGIAFSVLGIELPEVDPATDSFDDIFAALSTEYIIGSAFFQAIAFAIPVGALQVAAARLYLEQRYGRDDEWRYY